MSSLASLGGHYALLGVYVSTLCCCRERSELPSASRQMGSGWRVPWYFYCEKEQHSLMSCPQKREVEYRALLAEPAWHQCRAVCVWNTGSIWWHLSSCIGSAAKLIKKPWKTRAVAQCGCSCDGNPWLHFAGPPQLMCRDTTRDVVLLLSRMSLDGIGNASV